MLKHQDYSNAKYFYQTLENVLLSSSPDDRTVRSVTIWLVIIIVMVVTMIIIGGITRLTGSGLSIVNWRPITGWLPPMSDIEWRDAFSQYKGFPEYRKINSWMDLGDFRLIFWWEYMHRLWGRLIGIAFIIPFVWFLLRSRLSKVLILRLGFILMLGGVQGGIGWWMVKSGLSGDPTVSQYRLVLHLSIAFIILGLTVWTILDMNFIDNCNIPKSFRIHAILLLVMIFLTILAGALVAGTKAGLVYNTFPFMDGRIIPNDYGYKSPFWINIFENQGAVQFNHRVLALSTFIVTLYFLWRVARHELPMLQTIGTYILTGIVILQLFLGILTLIFVVPTEIAVAHQIGAIMLFCSSIWVVHLFVKQAET